MKKLRQVEYHSCDYCDTETEYKCQICNKDICAAHLIFLRIFNFKDKQIRTFGICKEHLDKKAQKLYDDESNRDYESWKDSYPL